MGNIKIKVKVSASPGVKSVPISQFLKVSGKVIDFLEDACDTLCIDANINNWTAGSFQNRSIGYVLEGNLAEKEQHRLVRELDSIMGLNYDVISSANNGRTQMVNKYLSIVEPFYNGGEVKIGLLAPNKKRFKFHSLNNAKAQHAKEQLDTVVVNYSDAEIVYYGAVRGVIYTWHKEGNKPYVEIKDINTNDNVKCYYQDNLYQDIYSVLSGKNNQVLITGKIIMDRKEKHVKSMHAKRFELMKKYDYQEGDIDKFIGCANGITGGLSAREYIERIHGEGE